MDDQRQRIAEDLAGMLEGEVRSDPLTIAMYSSDASLYEVAPWSVAFPRCVEDVAVLARYADESNLALIPRGAGTGLAGGALGSGIVVDFSRHMHRIERVDEETVRVQPGVVRSQLNRILAKHGRYFPPDPSNSEVTTVGGMLAMDAAGSHSVRVGSMRDHVQSVEMVLAGGQIIEFGNEALSILDQPAGSPSVRNAPSETTREFEVRRNFSSRLSSMLREHAATIAEHQPALIRNCSGYHLKNVLTSSHLAMPRLLVGSEGTLGAFTAATLHTALLPSHRGVTLLLFSHLDDAVRAVQVIAPLQPSACDLLDRRLLSLAREADPRFAEILAPAAEAALLVEQTGFDDAQVRLRMRMIRDAARALRIDMVVARESFKPDEVDFLWSLPSRVVSMLARLRGNTRPVPFVEDIVVPPVALSEFLRRAQRVLQKHRVTASLYAHAAAGQLHLRPFLPNPGPSEGPRIRQLASELYEIVFSVGGSISGEHGDGLARSEFVEKQYGPLYPVFQQIKELFDPHNVFNPGKIVNAPAEQSASDLRPDVSVGEMVELQLQWTSPEIRAEAAECNGCGVCKTHEDEFRMCPFFRVQSSEESSPRSKANIFRALGSPEMREEMLRSPEMKELTNLCFNCKQCQLECPSHVDIPHLMLEARASHVAANGLSRADWILSRAHSFGMVASRFSWLVNRFLSRPLARWAIEKTIGIARQRKLPRFTGRPFLKRIPKSVSRTPELKQTPRPVIYFVDHYANYHDPELAQAFIAILFHNGIPVYVPPQQTVSGMARISAGDLESAREIALENIRLLGGFARDQFTIVCTEPAAALCLREEYPRLLEHPDVPAIADQTMEAGAFLADLHQRGRLRTDFNPLDLDVGYHQPCHLKALAGDQSLRELLSLIPELRVRTIEKGCSGMAGTFGLTSENYATSIRIGWDLISEMRDATLDAGCTECSSCKIQMEQGTSTPTIHPLKLMALAYGLMPEIRDRLQQSRRKLVVT